MNRLPLSLSLFPLPSSPLDQRPVHRLVAHESQDYVFNSGSQSWSCECPALTKFTVTKQGGELELVPLVRRLSRSDKVSGIRFRAGHDTRSNKIHRKTVKLSSKVSLSEKVYCIIISERTVMGRMISHTELQFLDRKGREKVIPPFPKKLMIKPRKGQNTPLSY